MIYHNIKMPSKAETAIVASVVTNYWILGKLLDTLVIWYQISDFQSILPLFEEDVPLGFHREKSISDFKSKNSMNLVMD